MANKVHINGFGDESVNGTYYDIGTFNGYPAYQKGSDYYLAYYVKNMPYCYESAYYIIKRNILGDSASLNVPLYMKLGNSVSSVTTWKGLSGITSGQNATGTTIFDDDSSSSSSSSNSSSSSSSSSSLGNSSSSSSSVDSSSSSSSIDD